jgi:hypothetical protein
MITFLTFHIEKEKANIGNTATLKANIKSLYHLLIALVFRSASLFHPQCEKVVLSDMTTSFDYLDSSVKIFRTEIKPDNSPLMYARLFAQLEYVKQHDFNSNLVFLDSDILINANLEYLFRKDFDVALTYRDNDDMPINWGVMFISQRSKHHVVNFLENILKRYEEEYFAKDIFWCDQYALMDVINRDKFFKRSSDNLDLHSLRLMLVPCDTYNFPPEDVFTSIAQELISKEIIHFKGHRKRLMNIYWKAYLARSECLNVSTLRNSLVSKIHILYNSYIEILKQQQLPGVNLVRKAQQLLIKYIAN